ncbi:CRISPR-associated helicase/endonuclease Cas3 [Thermodesulfobacteriota bacterium B35]
MVLLAHSAQKGTPEQCYRDHVQAVSRKSLANVEGALNFFSGEEDEKDALLHAIGSGASLHDLGKVDERNQEVLATPGSGGRLPVNHADAGTAWLLRQRALNGALLVYCHHSGLFSLSEECKKQDGRLAFRDTDIADEVGENLHEYIAKHQGEFDLPEVKVDTLPLKGFSLRLALSCLVDADHNDTACHYGGESPRKRVAPKWEKRRESLHRYVQRLSETTTGTGERNQLRSELYAACADGPIEPALKFCDAPVGSGKTTAVMAHLLAVASSRKLRHIFVVLPYTNIIEQSVEVYRKAIVLEGENPEAIVAAHYHQADFSDVNSRQLATLWGAPVIVTSAVQFFETLSSCRTSRLRKLHELPGSAVFVDESHAAMPLYIWPQQWEWIQELTKKWRCYFVFASGSLVKFWEYSSFSTSNNHVSCLLPDSLRRKLKDFEEQRVVYPVRKPPLDRNALINLVVSKSGPRLVILNTVQSAAVIAHEMKKRNENVLHLSTALTPKDRKRIIHLVSNLLANKTMPDWTLVTTSCVEAGVDFSFKTAFRESCSVTSLIQTGGRANRHGMDMESEIIDFRVRDPFLNKHPAFDDSRAILDQMFDEGLLQSMPPIEAATESVRRELERNDIVRKAKSIQNEEERQEYRKVEKLTRLIDADTRTVVICRNIIKRLLNREKVSSVDLLQNSVQFWSNKVQELELQSFRYFPELYYWDYPYDPDFIGYMKGLLPMVYQYADDEYGLVI